MRRTVGGGVALLVATVVGIAIGINGRDSIARMWRGADSVNASNVAGLTVLPQAAAAQPGGSEQTIVHAGSTNR